MTIRLKHGLLVLWSLSILVPGSWAQGTADEATQRALPNFNLLPFDEDWSLFAGLPKQVSVLDRIKYIRFQDDAGAYLSIGGEFRGVYERVLNDNWTNHPASVNSFGLERYQFHTDIHFSPRVRTFIELESDLEEGRPNGPRPVDEKRLDLLNAFVDVRVGSKPHSVILRVGKQELQLGSGRSVSVREGTNVRQGFFGVRADHSIAGWDVTGFVVRPAIDRPGFFNGGPNGGVGFWGVLANRKWKRNDSFSFNSYYYGLNQKSAIYNRGAAGETRQTIGANFVANPPDVANRLAGLHVDVEGIYQFGSFGESAIRAWTIATETGISLSRLPRTPKLGLRADISSGDKGGNSALGTFNPLFPAGNYFGVLADTGPGPLNFRDLHPEFILPLPHGITITPDWIFWWRQQLEDGVYSMSGMLIVPAGKSTARYVGNRPGIEAHWQVNRHTYMHLSYGVFFAGPFLKQSGHRQNLNYFAYGLGYKF